MATLKFLNADDDTDNNTDVTMITIPLHFFLRKIDRLKTAETGKPQETQAFCLALDDLEFLVLLYNSICKALI